MSSPSRPEVLPAISESSFIIVSPSHHIARIPTLSSNKSSLKILSIHNTIFEAKMRPAIGFDKVFNGCLQRIFPASLDMTISCSTDKVRRKHHVDSGAEALKMYCSGSTAENQKIWRI